MNTYHQVLSTWSTPLSLNPSSLSEINIAETTPELYSGEEHIPYPGTLISAGIGLATYMHSFADCRGTSRYWIWNVVR